MKKNDINTLLILFIQFLLIIGCHNRKIESQIIEKKPTDSVSLISNMDKNNTDKFLSQRQKINSISSKLNASTDIKDDIPKYKILKETDDTIIYVTTLKDIPAKNIDSIQIFISSLSNNAINNYFEIVDSIKLFMKNNSIETIKLISDDYFEVGHNLDNTEFDFLKFTNFNSDNNLDLLIFNSAISGTGFYLGNLYLYDIELNSYLIDSLLTCESYLEYNKELNLYCSHASGGGGNYGFGIFKIENNRKKILETLQVNLDIDSGKRIRKYTKGEHVKIDSFDYDYPLAEEDSLTRRFLDFQSEEVFYAK